MSEHLTEPSEKSTQLLVLRVSLVMLPLVLTTILIGLFYQSTIFDFVPIYTDEQFNWRTASAFSAVGFEGGHHTLDEDPVPADNVRFYAWGPSYPIIYGGLGRLFGWAEYSQVIINLIFLTAALVYFVVKIRPNTSQTLLMGTILVIFSAVLHYIPSGYQESLNHAIAIFFGTSLYCLLTQPAQVSLREKLIIFGLLIIAVQIRLTWALLFFPLVWLSFPKPRWYIRGLLTLSTIPILLVSYIVFSRFAAPYPAVYSNFSSYIVGVFDLSAAKLFSQFKNHVAFHGLRYLKFSVEIIQTQWMQLLLIIIVIASLIGIYRLKLKRRRQIGIALIGITSLLLLSGFLYTLPIDTEAATTSFIRQNYQTLLDFQEGIHQIQFVQLLFVTVAASILLVSSLKQRTTSHVVEAGIYLFITITIAVAVVFVRGTPNWVAYRHFAAFLVFLGTVFALRERKNWILGLALMSLWMAPLTLHRYRYTHQLNFEDNNAAITAFAEIAAEHISYDPEADPWCNTTLVEIFTYCNTTSRRPGDHSCNPAVALGIPEGIGYSWAGDVTLLDPIASRWVLTYPDEEYVERAARFEQMQGETLVLVAETDIVNIYENQESMCVN